MAADEERMSGEEREQAVGGAGGDDLENSRVLEFAKGAYQVAAGGLPEGMKVLESVMIKLA